MRLRLFLLISVLAGTMLGVTATASAYFVHVVTPGETLSSIAAQDGLSVDALAAANGLSPDTQLLAGSTIAIPPQGTTAVTPVSAPTASGTTAASSTGGGSAAGGTTSGDDDNDGDETGTGTTVPASTSTSGAYVVRPGDTLSAIAARSGVSVDALAAANGLNPNSYLLTGTVIHLAGGSSATGTMVPVSDTTTTSTGSSYVVQAGDTLSAIAARSGESVNALAAANGLNPNSALLTGTVLRLSRAAGSATTASSDVATSQPVGTIAQGNPTDPPYPTPETVTSSEVGSIAAANGVPASLADAIGWQESGFNNDLVSSADARGVMQILPGTWQWIQQNLDNGPPLAPASAADNVRGGVLLLHSLLNATGGNQSLAAAGYFQGLPSVQQNGLYPSTQQYVNSVLALENQFGGGG